MIFNLTLNRVLAIGLMAVIMTPLLAGAQTDDNEARPTPINARGANICENLDTIKERLLNSVSERKDKRQNHQSNRAADTGARKADRLARLEIDREKADAIREARYERLENAATTDAQTVAVAEFKATVEALMDERRDLVDEAVAAFEVAVDEINADLAEVTETVAADIAAAIEAAFADVEDTCAEDDVDPADIRSDINTAIEAARNDVKETRAALSLREDFAAAQATLRSAVEAAKADFLAGLEEAKTDLKAAFEI